MTITDDEYTAIDEYTKKGYATVLMMMAYKEFDAYSTAKKEVYLEQLANLGFDRIPSEIDRESVEGWKRRIAQGDDLYPRKTT